MCGDTGSRGVRRTAGTGAAVTTAGRDPGAVNTSAGSGNAGAHDAGALRNGHSKASSTAGNRNARSLGGKTCRCRNR